MYEVGSNSGAQPSTALEPSFHSQLTSRLHDDIAQSLAMALVHLDEAWSGHEPEAFRRGHRLVLQAMQSTRALISQLVQQERPMDVPTADLPERLLNCVQSLQQAHGTCLEFVCDGHPGTLPCAISDTLVSSTQELLINALKCARTGRIEVRVMARPGRLAITVRDQGIGLAAAPPIHSSGLGLPLMRIRLASIGATLHWRSASWQGVQARIRWSGTPS